MNPLGLFSSSSRFACLVVATLIAVAVWALGAVNAFHVTDGLIYDYFLRFRSHFQQQPVEVLLVEVRDRSELRDPESLAQALTELDRLGARQVVFATEVPQVAPDFYQTAAQLGNVVFARTLLEAPYDPERLVFSRKPELWQTLGLPSGILHSPPSTAGVCRRQHTRFSLDGETLPSLQVLVARRLGVPTPAGDQYLVDFREGLGSLPHFGLDRVLRGDLIPELVKGKVVIVGLRRAAGEPGLYTPTTTASQTMSLLEYQGHALNTLLSGRATQELGMEFLFCLLLCEALLTCLVYQSFSVQAASWFTGILLVACAGSGLAAFCYAQTWLPLTQLACCQLALFLFTVRGRALELTHAMRRLISDSSSQLRDKYWPSHFHTTTPSWALVANMINQTLDLNKLIFLEAEPGTPKLKEILALHCSLNDIVERRRDYTRSPYVDALRAKGPIKVEDYLKTKNLEEVHYIAPLLFCGKLLGFWAIGIDRGKAKEIPEFEQLLRDYTRRISELLHHAREAADSDSMAESLRSRFAVERTEVTYQNLQSTLGLLDNRLATLELLINRVNSGVIVYDIFGRILQINEVMLELLRKEDLAPFEMTALDLILALSDYDISRSRKLLRHVIVEDKTVSFPVTFRAQPDHRFLIFFKPLHEDAADSGQQEDDAGVRSVLCELVDTTATAFLSEMKTHLTDRLGLQLRSDLAAIDMSSSLLGMSSIQGEQRQAIAEIVQSKVQNSVRTLSECQQYLAVDDDVEELERFPVDPAPALDAAMDDAADVAKKRGVEVRLRKPNFVSYVFASSRKLQELFTSIVTLLTHDASDESTILVRVTENQDVVAFDFSDMGFGIPDDLLQEYLFGDHPLASAEFQRVQNAAKWVDGWGGLLEATSGVGVGMHFTVHLVKFI